MSESPLTEKQQHWLKHLTDYESFTGTLKEYAVAHDLKLTDLYGWRKTLRDKGVIKPITKPTSHTNVSSFTRLPFPVSGGGQTLQLRTGRVTIMLPELPDPHWLATVIMALESQP